MIHIISCSRNGEFKEPAVENLTGLLSDKDSITWVDFDNPTEKEVSLLTDVFKFHPLAIEDCLSFVPNPKIDDYGDYLYVVIHG
ncbi:MAG TPA: CorA family divalent cation transporter, partial [Nitrospinota bacterium]|nr:CorA family divalent cation transporter [Nitrospinota bacterium]